MIFKNNLQKTLVVVVCSALVSGIVSYLLQDAANKNTQSCSYLDPIIIDLVAFLAGLFLLIEGFFDIFAHKECFLSAQLGRCIRVCFGVSILVIHIMQFIHK